MRKEDLRELAGNDNFISGIYNYCDRWCERCQFTSRCLLYATERADPDLDDPEVRDFTNEKFWRKLHEIFRTTGEMIREWAAEAGIDLDAVNVESETASHGRAMAEAEQSEIGQTAHQYTRAVESWFREEFTTNEKVHDITRSHSPSENLAAGEAAEVIRWYQFFITVKLLRALSDIGEVDEEEIHDEQMITFDAPWSASDDQNEDIDYDEIMARTSLMDANGSAKIALAAIDRSIAAWRVLQMALPEKSKTIKPLLINLEKLRHLTETRFPHARDFIRPGFDEAVSAFVS